MHPLQILCEDGLPAEYGDFLLESSVERVDTSFLGRCWTVLGKAWQVSRRYSIVASEVSLFALNILFLTCKADEKIPKKVSEVTLALLSTIGIISLNYTVDFAWKTFQDARYAFRVKNRPIAALASVKLLQQTSNIALTCGSFIASIYGATGHKQQQLHLYRNMTVWGEVSIVTGVALMILSLLVTYRTSKKLKVDTGEGDSYFTADIRFCMDKDTLWHTLKKVKAMDDFDQLDEVMDIVKKNIDTQLKVTLGARLGLIVVGDALQIVEKIYTPDSLVSAIINCVASTGYAVKISVEKGLEYNQRKKLNQATESKELMIALDEYQALEDGLA